MSEAQGAKEWIDMTIQSPANEKTDAYKYGIGQMEDRLPEVVDAYNRFTGACFREGNVSARNKQLIALGISLFANNEICTYYHVQEALSEGASEAEIMECAAVAAALGGGHALSQGVTRVRKALSEAKS